MNSNKNISTVSSEAANLAKVIATFGVVLTHSYKLFRYMGIRDSEVFYLNGFHAFAACGVPVFFLLSGYFLMFKDNFDYQKNLRKKIRSLAIPYCLFMLVYAFISCAGSLVLPEFFDDFRKFTPYDWFMRLVGIPFVIAPRFYGPLWFVRELIIFNILSFALVPAVKKIPGYILVPAMVVIYFLPISQIIRYSIPFFLIGMYCGYKKRIPIFNKPIHIMGVFVVGFIITLIFEGSIYWKISVFLMAASILMVSGKLIGQNRIKEMVKIAIPYSFPIYLMHEYPMTTMMRLLALKHITIPLAITAFFVAPLLVISMCICVVIIWKRISPKTYTLFTGGR